jgi:predicted acylesterase/phospholipase RssA
VEIGDEWYVDGGLRCNHPVSVFEGQDPETVLGARVDDRLEITGEPAQMKAGLAGLGEYFQRCLGISLEGASAQYVPEHLWRRIIRIDVTDIPGLDFGPAYLERLLQAGRRAVTDFELSLTSY